MFSKNLFMLVSCTTVKILCICQIPEKNENTAGLGISSLQTASMSVIWLGTSNFCVEFGIPLKIIRLIKNVFNLDRQTFFLYISCSEWPETERWFVTIAFQLLQYAVKKVVPVGSEGLKLNGTLQHVVSADDTYLLDKNVNAVKKNTSFVS